VTTALEKPTTPTLRPSQKLWHQVLQLFRRLHLYFGLFSLPWVVLYAVTALLFNHPELFPDEQVVTFDARSFPAAPKLLEQPDAVAEQVVSALHTQHPEQFDKEKLVLSTATAPQFTRKALVNVRSGEKDLLVIVDLVDGGGWFVVKDAVVPAELTPLEKGLKIDVKSDLTPRVEQSVRDLLAKNGYPVETISFKSPPEVIFAARVDGQEQLLKFTPQTGIVNTAPEISWRRFLLRLHLTHVYPSSLSARWIWALCVDAMFVCLIFWSFSGVLMWWQIKRLRFWGFVTLGASLLCGAALFVAMASVIVT